jgi:hypothetical protein
MCSPRCSQIAPHNIPHILPKVELPYIYIYKDGPMGHSSMLLFWGVPNLFIFNCNGPIKVTTSTKIMEEKKTLWVYFFN